MALNGRRQLFVLEYLRDLNATAAAIRAGYSPRTARQQASLLLQDPAVADAVVRAQAARAERCKIDADWVLERLARIADSDVRRIFNGRELKLPEELDDATAYSVAGIDVVTVAKGQGEVEHVAKIKFWDKRAALVDIGRHLGMFKDKVDVEHSGGVTVVLNGDEANL